MACLTKKTAIIWMLFFLILLTPQGCALFKSFDDKPIELDISARIYPADSSTAVKRVLIYPFSNESSFKNQTRVVADAFSEALAQQGCFELALISEADEKTFKNLDSSSTGRFPLSLLVELGSYFKVDAILVSNLKMYNPYNPQVISIKADLISVHNGKVLRSLNGIVDAGTDMVTRDIIKYYYDECSRDSSLDDYNLISLSPKLYARYASHRFVNAMFPNM